MTRSAVFLLSALLSLSACTTTTSFAPPPISVSTTGQTATSFACPAEGPGQTTVAVDQTVEGASELVDVFIAALRCSAHAAANGRQSLEIPAFVATAGAAAASALGGGATYGILGTVANGAFNAGKSYWDPRAKAAIFDHALDAMLCIKTEAVGIDAYKFDNNPVTSSEITEKGVLKGGDGQPSTVSVRVEQQYFAMVSAAAFSVERILAQRLSNVGTVDASAVAAEIKQAAQEQAKAEQKREGGAGGGGGEGGAGGGGDKDNAEMGFFLNQFNHGNDRRVDLDLAVLKPKLDQCVIRGKL